MEWKNKCLKSIDKYSWYVTFLKSIWSDCFIVFRAWTRIKMRAGYVAQKKIDSQFARIGVGVQDESRVWYSELRVALFKSRNVWCFYSDRSCTQKTRSDQCCVKCGFWSRKTGIVLSLVVVTSVQHDSGLFCSILH